MLFGQQYNNTNDLPSSSASAAPANSSTTPTASTTFKVKTKSRRRKPKPKQQASTPLTTPTTSTANGAHGRADMTNGTSNPKMVQNYRATNYFQHDTQSSRASANGKMHSVAKEANVYPSVWKMLGFKTQAFRLSPQNTDKPICVTGIDGFAASWIAAELLACGYKVRGTIQSRSDEISQLLKLPQAKENLTVIEASLLTPESCELAVEGCDYVIHTGTPSSCSVRDPLSESLEPGVHSIGSRMHCIIPMMTNFIQACARSSIKKLVLSSSVAAIADSVCPNKIMQDTNWNTNSTLERNPHFLSLKLAEESAWQLVAQLPRDSKFDLVAINSGTLIGPALCEMRMAPGNQVIYDLIAGKYSALVDLNWSMVDVRDNAKAHVNALENMDASGRFICVNRTIWLKDIVDVLASNGFSGRDLPWKVGLPNWVARLPSYATQLGQVGAALYAVPSTGFTTSPYSNEKIKNVLHITFRKAESSIIDAAKDLLKWKIIKPWAEDHEAIECDCCKLPFSFYRRKHHCRECGVIICADCSKSRAVVEGLQDKARLCDSCVRSSIPELLELLKSDTIEDARKGVVALESLMENPNNHEYLTRIGGIPLLLATIHVPDEIVALHGAGALFALSMDISSSLQMVLEGAVLQMLEVDESSATWRIALQTLRNLWRHINGKEFRKMLHAVVRVSTDAAIGALRGNILLTFVHMMDPHEIPTLLPEGLIPVLTTMLTSREIFPRCAAAHAIKHLIPLDYNPDVHIDVPKYVVDDHEELLTNTALSDLQFLVKGNIAPINAHKVVLFFRNSFFKNMFGSSSSQKSTVEVDNCSHEVFSVLLRFLYTGRVHIESSTAQELLAAASYYQVHELQKQTEKFLAGEITVDNVVDLLYLSDSCHAEDLQRVCTAFLLQNIHSVVPLPSYERHLEWTSRQVLSALANLLGKEWEESHLEVVRRQQEQVNAVASPVLSPLAQVLATRYSPRKGPDAETSTSPAVSGAARELEVPVKSKHFWSDDLSDRSEGVC